MTTQKKSNLGKSLAYILSYFKDLRVAGPTPSSPKLVARVVRHLKAVDPRLIIELGPGDGVATREALLLLPPDGELIVIERNPEFVDELKSWPDERLKVIDGDARKLGEYTKNHLGQADAVIASVPFTLVKYFTPADRLTIVKDAHRLLRPGGVFVIFYQYTPLMAKVIRHVFGEVTVEHEWRNAIPAYVMSARKK